MALTQEQIALFNSKRKKTVQNSVAAFLSLEPIDQDLFVKNNLAIGKNENFASFSLSCDNYNELSELATIVESMVILYKGKQKEPIFKPWDNGSVSVSIMLTERRLIAEFISVSRKTEN